MEEVVVERLLVSLTMGMLDVLVDEEAYMPVGLEFVIRPPLEAGPCPGSGRSNAHG